MPPAFVLDVDVKPATRVVDLRLKDGAGGHLGDHQVEVGKPSPALWQGLFDTRSYVRRYAETGQEAALLAGLGVFLGREVLGAEILQALAGCRALRVQVPKAAEEPLAAAFARVPWEIARPSPEEKALFERNLVVRMEVPGAVPASAHPLGGDEELRVLLVFAEAPGSRPLAMRLEREQLLALFHDQVMPQRQVTVDVLCHGVTRQALTGRVRETSGYHVVHWSGHGHQNLLELLREDGKPDRLDGAGLVELFDDAGGFTPQLVFLSAYLSGALVEARDWAALRAALREGEAATAKEESPGYTGTALALLGAGVPQVVAMRYEVGDAYARALAGLFYRRLLADPQPKPPAEALALARRELLNQHAADHEPVDHATPLLFGVEAGPFPVPRGQSSALLSRRPQPQPLLTDSHELDRPAELVGRGKELSKLRACLEEGQPVVALGRGLAGLRKTALVAEAIQLWHRRFGGVFAFQSKPLKLPLDEFYRRLDERLTLHSKTYREVCEQNPYRQIHLPPGKLSGEARWRQMRDNLLEALRNERLLLVLDNFETNLESVQGKDGYACADPEWDRLLGHLAEELPGTGSRLLVTSRHRLASLSSALWLPLGPLPMGEAALFLQGALKRLAFGDAAGWQLASRLLAVSRGHPLILTYLGKLAGDRQALKTALDELEAKGLDRLPDVFAPLSEAQRKDERAYLEDVAVGSVDVLIERASSAARQVLWRVTLAGEPVPEGLVLQQTSAPPVGPLLAAPP